MCARARPGAPAPIVLNPAPHRYTPRSLVSKTAFPTSPKALGPLHAISLEAVCAIMGALAARCVIQTLLNPKF